LFFFQVISLNFFFSFFFFNKKKATKNKEKAPKPIKLEEEERWHAMNYHHMADRPSKGIFHFKIINK